MKRLDGILLQTWAHQELRLHLVKRGLRLIQWRERVDKASGRSTWDCGAWNFDGTLGPVAEAVLREALNNRAAFAMLDVMTPRLRPDPSVLDKRGQITPHRWEEPHDVPGQSTCWLCLLHRDDAVHTS